MSRNDDRELGHGDEYDGIEEYDNPLPDWWLGLFFLCIAWAVVYWVDWTFVRQPTQEALYEQELADAKVRWPDLDREQGMDTSPETLALGAETFQGTCASCHHAELTGGVGPSLIDDVWVHGSDFDAITRTITDGVPAKGMPAWGAMLGPKKIAAVASFILSKQGSAPAASPGADPAGGGPAGDALASAAAPPEAAGAPSGEQVFAQNCVACHGADMKGGIGPDLTDAEWIHGGELADIRRIIEQGVPAKGMISWKGVLSDEQIEAVAVYIQEQSPR